MEENRTSMIERRGKRDEGWNITGIWKKVAYEGGENHRILEHHWCFLKF